jgi:hypothetical protein
MVGTAFTYSNINENTQNEETIILLDNLRYVQLVVFVVHMDYMHLKKTQHAWNEPNI